MLGEGSTPFSLLRNELDVEISSSTTTPTIEYLTVLYSRRTTCNVKVILSQPGEVYCMVTNKGSKEPTPEEIIAQ